MVSYQFLTFVIAIFSLTTGVFIGAATRKSVPVCRKRHTDDDIITLSKEIKQADPIKPWDQQTHNFRVNVYSRGQA